MLCPPRLLYCPPWAGHPYLLIFALCPLAPDTTWWPSPFWGLEAKAAGWVVLCSPSPEARPCISACSDFLPPCPQRLFFVLTMHLASCTKVSLSSLGLPPSPTRPSWLALAHCAWDRCSVTVSGDCIRVGCSALLYLELRWRGLDSLIRGGHI